MAEKGFKRKLTAILSADVEGYSRLMGEDEEATVRTLTTYREVLTTLIQQHNGKVLDSPGDNLLAEFASVVDAVQCAVAVQKEIKSRNDELPENRKMQFRIGINLGDVIQEEDRIYGDGVNIAARLESLAEPGGICISKTAFDHIESKLPYGYDFIGDQTVKNIAKPIGAYRVLLDPRVTVAGKSVGEKLVSIRRKTYIFGAVAILVVAVVVGIWKFSMRQPLKEPVSDEKMLYPTPDKPSIAVLPFDNLSGDPDQEFFSDGITENIIGALSKTPRLYVIARHSAFTYKGKSVKIQQVGRELGVRYVLEGSVQKTEDRVRITAQLIDAITDEHLWSERYDRNLTDVFAIQDEITLEIIKALRVELTPGERAHITGLGTKKLDAYLKAIRASNLLWRKTDKENIRKARQMALEAIGIDPQYGYPHAIVAYSHMWDVWIQATDSRKKSMQLAAEAAQKALELDDSDPRIHGMLSDFYTMQGEHDKSIASAKRSIELNPGDSRSYKKLADLMKRKCKYDEAISLYEKALKLDPFPNEYLYRDLAGAFYNKGRNESAILMYKKALRINANEYFTHLGLVLSYSKLGRKEEARAAAEEALRINPRFSLDWYAETVAKLYAEECRQQIFDSIEFIRNENVGLN